MTRAERTYPEPAINMETETYWAAAKDGKLLLKKCNTCGETHYYPRAICPHCLSGDTAWYEASGKGTIYTYSVMRRTATPYVIAYVTLAEGITMMSNIVECDVDSVAIGDDVEVCFRATEGDQALPVFRKI